MLRSFKKPKLTDLEPAFPKLMYAKNEDIVVLFQTEGIGTVVNECQSGYKVGDHRRDWITQNFVDYAGAVVLQNNQE